MGPADARGLAATLTCPRSIAAAGRTNSVLSESGTRVPLGNLNQNLFGFQPNGSRRRQRPGGHSHLSQIYRSGRAYEQRSK